MTESWASSEHARRTMRANKRRDTKPELETRKILHARGLRYRVDMAPVKGLRRRADIVFTRVKLAVFIDGCFWHGCPEHFIMPKTNQEYWSGKIEANRARDSETDRFLREEGWEVLRFWEHDDAERSADQIFAQWRARTANGRLSEMVRSADAESLVQREGPE